jgi:polysaccharide deacetylase family sporulation protein PdaB
VFWAAVCSLLLGSSSYAAPKKNRAYYEARGEVVWEVPTSEKAIALTFDDGPHPQYTPRILELLKQYDAKATFFLTGKKVETYPELVKREHIEGHELANHSYNHIFFNKRRSLSKLKQEVLQTDAAIFKASGQKSHLFRPPGGFYNEKLVSIAKDEGYMVVMWSWHQDTKDWNSPGVNKIVDNVLSDTRNGDIVLFHDYSDGSAQTVEALKIILPKLQERGYRFVTVSELLTYSKLKPREVDEEILIK